MEKGFGIVSKGVWKHFGELTPLPKSLFLFYTNFKFVVGHPQPIIIVYLYFGTQNIPKYILVYQNAPTLAVGTQWYQRRWAGTQLITVYLHQS